MKLYNNQEIHLHKSISLPNNQVYKFDSKPETGFPLFSQVFFSFSIEKKEVNKEPEIKKELEVKIEEPKTITDKVEILKYLEDENVLCKETLEIFRRYDGPVELIENYDEFY